MSKNITAMLIALLSLAVPFAAKAGVADQQPRVIELVADKDNVFKVPGQSKPVITLKAGEKIILRITSYAGGERGRDGAVHGFTIKKLHDQGWDFRLKEGTQDYALVAPATPGEYVAECTVKCGRGHEDMTMKIVVKP
jgi:heme/copper-type cytochrome/quinol oxidase subunit 2